MRTAHKWLYALVCIVLAGNLLIGLRVYSEESKDEDGAGKVFDQISVLMRVLHLIRQEYVEPEKTDTGELIENAITGMVDSLDPFSSYLPPQAYQEMKENTTGEFGGIGIVVTLRDDDVTVVTPIEGTPGSRAGIQAGDKIVAVNGEKLREPKLRKAVELMKGEPGTEISIKIVREEEEEPIELTIEREIIKVPTIKDVRMLEGNVGYLRITQFNENTAGKLKTELEGLKKQSLNSLIIDVRNNPGGLLKSAVTCTDYFLPPDQLIVSVKGRTKEPKETYHSSRPDMMAGIPIAILVNNGSASAAEILAGCLQDVNRAVLLGVKTFGKGSVQNVIALPDQSALRLTTAKYHTPSDREIHGNGIKPDITVELTKEEKKKLFDFQHKLGPQEREDEGMFLDPQLKRAVELMRNYHTLRHPQKAEATR